MIWRPHSWLRPLSPVYLLVSRLHRLRLQGKSEPGFRPTIPLVVIGALKSGGSGKTSVTLALARILTRSGLKVAILVYRIGRDRNGIGVEKVEKVEKVGNVDWVDMVEVAPDGDWRRTSDEAVILRRESGARVFATRNRARAWKRLHELRSDTGSGPYFDIILSDDGFQDPRLTGAIRLLLNSPGARPGLFDLLPGGPYREAWAARSRADLILEGPFPDPEPVPEGSMDPGTGKQGAVETHRFRRRFHFPQAGTPGKWIVLAAHGDPAPFLADLGRVGVRPDAVLTGRNHRALPLVSLTRLMRHFPGARIACTRKEAIRLEGAGLPPESLAVAEQAIEFEARTLALLADRCGLILASA